MNLAHRVADRIGERLTGIRTPKVHATEVSSAADRVSVTVHTDEGSVTFVEQQEASDG